MTADTPTREELARDIEELCSPAAESMSDGPRLTALINAARRTVPFLRTLPPAAAGGGWRGIETAPKMQNILLFAITDTETGNWRMETGFWHSAYGGTWYWGALQPVKPYDVQPTHWQPLPEPPPHPDMERTTRKPDSFAQAMEWASLIAESSNAPSFVYISIHSDGGWEVTDALPDQYHGAFRVEHIKPHPDAEK